MKFSTAMQDACTSTPSPLKIKANLEGSSPMLMPFEEYLKIRSSRCGPPAEYLELSNTAESGGCGQMEKKKIPITFGESGGFIFYSFS